MYLTKIFVIYFFIDCLFGSINVECVAKRYTSLCSLTKKERQNFKFFKMSVEYQLKTLNRSLNRNISAETARLILHIMDIKEITQPISYLELDLIAFLACFLGYNYKDELFNIIIRNMEYDLAAYHFFDNIYNQYDNNDEDKIYIRDIYISFLMKIALEFDHVFFMHQSYVCVKSKQQTGIVKLVNETKSRFCLMSFEFFYKILNFNEEVNPKNDELSEKMRYMVLISFKCMFGLLNFGNDKFIPNVMKINGCEENHEKIFKLVYCLKFPSVKESLSGYLKLLCFKNCFLCRKSTDILSISLNINYVSVKLCTLEHKFISQLFNKNKPPLKLAYLIFENSIYISPNIKLPHLNRKLEGFKLNNNSIIDPISIFEPDILFSIRDCLVHLSVNIFEFESIDTICILYEFKKLKRVEFYISLPNPEHVFRFIQRLNILFLKIKINTLFLIVIQGIVMISSIRFNWDYLENIKLHGIIINDKLISEIFTYTLSVFNIYFYKTYEFGGTPIFTKFNGLFRYNHIDLNNIIVLNNLTQRLVELTLDFSYINIAETLNSHIFSSVANINIYNYSEKNYQMAEYILNSIQIPKMETIYIESSENILKLFRLFDLKKLLSLKVVNCDNFRFGDVFEDFKELKNLNILRIKLESKTSLTKEDLAFLKEIKSLKEIYIKGHETNFNSLIQNDIMRKNICLF